MVENKTRYEFECLDCHHAFSQVWIFQDDGLKCPRCGSQFNKVISKTEEEPTVVKSDYIEVLVPKPQAVSNELAAALCIGKIVMDQLKNAKSEPVLVRWKEEE